ncbi:hypothetical protein [Aliikangiella coralliicola]|uniref:DUF1269 domain-containing protein n=1 Tax=Aliikangiella coralliicola TaxID=2592383 RepID=A0A545UIF7_9GAMM|nr:hypothetical protein [Aliikangiella coralliicola]TQV89256.1 hypothetical protein FLL46_03760 [Aliikangiella coralliicola]
MKRLYFLTKNIDSTESISHDIHAAGITDWDFHVLSKNDKGLYQRHIHSANMLQKTDFIHSAEIGVLKGTAIGLTVALVLSQIPIHDKQVPFEILIGIFLAGILFGAWHGGLFGAQNENFRLKPFHDKIEEGYYLIMIDVAKKQVDEIVELMKSKHPEARYCTKDSVMVSPFENSKEITF